jgi:hypothetical protein
MSKPKQPPGAASPSGTLDFSNPASKRLCFLGWPDRPDLRAQQEDGVQCGGCRFFAKLDADWGRCTNPRSPHDREIVFEHFTCAEIDFVGWPAS